MARKRRRARGRADEEMLIGADEQEEVSEDEVAAEKPAAAPKKEPVVQKAVAKPVAPKPAAKKVPGAGQKFVSFLKDVRAEMKKVSWPDKERTMQSTGVVIFTLVVLSLIMAGFTVIFTRIAEILYRTEHGA